MNGEGWKVNADGPSLVDKGFSEQLEQTNHAVFSPVDEAFV
jgi:hypothetical protein